MAELRRKVTIKAKTTRVEDSETSKKPNVALKKKQPLSPTSQEPAVQPPVGPDSPKHFGKVIWGIVALVAILACIYYFVSNSNNNNNESVVISSADKVIQKEGNLQDTMTQEAAGEKDESVINCENTSASNQSKTSAVADEKESSSAEEVPANQSTKSSLVSKETSTSKVSSSTSPISGDVEQDARRVIRGEFGVGRVRKDALGTHYEEVQTRVNEIYREKGLL